MRCCCSIILGTVAEAVLLQEEKVEWLLDHLRLRSAWDAFDNGNAGALLRSECWLPMHVCTTF